MTARPSGAFCSPPSPRPIAIGTMPMIMARAVINTGRKRVYPAASAAVNASLPSSICSLAKLTTRMLFAVAIDKLLADLKSKGVLVTTVDKAAFQKATAPVVDKWLAAPIGPYVKKVVAAAHAN